MNDQDKSKEQLIEELSALRQRVAWFQAAAGEFEQDEATLRHLVDNLPDMLCQINADRTVQFVSPSVQRRLGYTPQDLIGTPALEQVHPDDLELINAIVRAAIIGKRRSIRIEYRYRHADGHYLWIEALMTLLYDEEGRYAGAIFSGRDISARKLTEQTLQMFQYTIDQATDAIFWINREAGFEYVNAQACKMLGYSHDELMSLCLWDIDPVFPKERWAAEWEAFQINHQGGTVHVESFQRHKDGTLIPVDVTAQHLWFEGRELHVALVRDITERKRAGAALRESEQRYRSLFDAVLVGLFRTTPEGKIIDANPAFVSMLRYPDRDSLLAVNAVDFYVDPHDRDKWRAALEREGMVSDYEVELRRFDGTTIWVADSVRAVYDDSQQIVHYEGAIADITERKRAEAALRESEEKFRGLVEGLNEAIFRMTLPDARYEYVSPSCQQVFGYGAEEFMNTPQMISKIIHPDFVDYHRQRWPDLLKGNVPPTYEYKIRDPEGKERWIFQSNRGIYDHQGNLVAMESLCKNVTERKRAEAALNESEERLRRALEGTTDGIWDWNVQTGEAYFSPRYYTMLGYEPREFPPSYENWRQLIHPDDLEHTEQVIQRELEEHSGFAMEFRLRTKEGDWLWVLGRGMVVEADSDNRAVRLAGSHSDISDRRRAEIRLEERNRFIDAILENAPIGFAVNSVSDGEAVFISSRFAEIYGCQPEQVTTVDQFFEAVYPDPVFREQIRERIVADIASGDSSRMRWENIPVALISGERRFVTAQNIPLWEQNLMISTVQDVTERKKAEDALRESEARYRSLFDDSPISLWEQDFSALKTYMDDLQATGVSDLDAYFEDHPEAVRDCAAKVKVVDANQATLALYGAQNKEDLLSGLERYVTEESLAALRQELVAFANGATHFVSENVNRTLTGTMLFCMISSSIAPGSEESWEKVLVSVIDITEQRRLEAESRQAEILRADLEKEMEIVALRARFISTVSHEFRTPLAVIQTSTDMLKRYYEKLSDDRRRQLLQQIIQQIAQMTYLIDSTLDISRAQAGKTEFSPAPVDLEPFCRNIFDQVQFTSGNQHTFVFRSNPPPRPVQVDGQLLHHILSNVLWNAIKYTPDAGRIAFELDHSSGEVVFRVIDEGIGIPEDDQERLFDPFHRAANVGDIKGTGLGLALVKQYVEIHGGCVALESQENEGSTFTISLPMR